MIYPTPRMAALFNESAILPKQNITLAEDPPDFEYDQLEGFRPMDKRERYRSGVGVGLSDKDTARRPPRRFVSAINLSNAWRALLLAAANIVVFAFLFLSLETGYRVYRDGLHEFVVSLTSGHNAAYSNLGTGNWVIYDPELGYRLNPARPTINSRSIRGPDITVPKPSGVFRVVVLGYSIPAAQPGFVDELSDQLKRRGVIEVINASTPGYTSYQELMFFKRYLVDTDPDLVIWAYCLNDNHKFLHRFDEQAHMLWTDEARESLGLGINTWWDWVVSRSYVLTAIRIGLIRPPDSSSMFPWEAREDFNTAWKDYSWLFYEEHLREMIELLKPRRARLAIIIFPYEPQLTLRTYRQSRDYILKPQTKLAALCEKYAVPCLDLYPRFEQAYDTGIKLYRDGIHFNPAGHHLTVAELMQFLDLHRLAPGTVAGHWPQGER